MKRVMTVVLAVALVALVGGAALAFGPGMGPGRMGFGPQMMGAGPQMMGSGMMGAAGGAACPGMSAATSTAPEAITEEKAKELATEYAAKYFKGFTVERVLPFAGRLHTMYQVELKGPKGETRVLHVNPWGGVMPFGAPVTEG